MTEKLHLPNPSPEPAAPPTQKVGLYQRLCLLSVRAKWLTLGVSFATDQNNGSGGNPYLQYKIYQFGGRHLHRFGRAGPLAARTMLAQLSGEVGEPGERGEGVVVPRRERRR